jgi:predicted nucleic acid-binding protein
VTELTLDASVVLKWFRSQGERNVEPARRLRAAYEAGELIVFAPTLLPLEIVNVAGRRWGWPTAELTRLAGALDELGIELLDPDLERVAAWTGAGLTAYDAAYVAVAEASGARLVTDDAQILEHAPAVATALSEA